jgi:hypothetical protein
MTWTRLGHRTPSGQHPRQEGVLLVGVEVAKASRIGVMAWLACSGRPARIMQRSSEPAKWLVPTGRGYNPYPRENQSGMKEEWRAQRMEKPIHQT